MFNHSRLHGELQVRRVKREVRAMTMYTVVLTSLVFIVWSVVILTVISDAMILLYG